MTRQRDIPSLQYRSPNLVNFTLPIVAGSQKFQVRGASRLNDAYGNVAGVGGFGTVVMFEVESGSTFLSPSIRARRVSTMDTNRGQSRVIYDPEDYTTPTTMVASYLPTDDNVAFLRIARYNNSGAAYLPEGPILVVPPYDFQTTKGPVITLTGKAPNLGIGAFPPNIPDTMLGRTMNFLLPAYLSTVSISNLSDTHYLFFSFHPGMSPTVLAPNQDMTLTGGGSPEMFVASPTGNPWFTIRASVINSA